MNSTLVTAMSRPSNLDRFSHQNPAHKNPFIAYQTGDLAAAREARKVKVAGWATLHLRQHFVDEVWMRDHIKTAGLRSPNQMEPATVTRLRSLLKRAKINGHEIKEVLGTTLSGYLKLNPLLPLWAALALVLEATGGFIVRRFSSEASDADSLGDDQASKTVKQNCH